MVLKYLTAFVLLIPDVHSFAPLQTTLKHQPTTVGVDKFATVVNLPLLAKKGEDDDRSGMNDAFASLNDLSADDFADDLQIEGSSRPSPALSSKPIVVDEKEIKKYTEMYEQMEKDDSGDVYSDILGDMGMTPTSSAPSKSDSAGKGFGKEVGSSKSSPVMNDADGIGSLVAGDEDQLIASDISPQDTDEFMAKALKEAMKEVEKQNKASGIDPRSLESSILNDKEMMKEINAVFDKANDQLLEGIKEIREEQAALTKASSERRTKALEDEEQRLREAEGSVSKLVEKVKRETLEVEKATRELEELSSELGQDPLMKAADLKQGGIVKQSALVGAVLFSLRSVGDIAMMGGADGASHGAAALVQGVIALACAAYLVFF